MKKTATHLTFKSMPKDYQRLCSMHLPRPIHDKIAYHNTLEIIEAMAGFEEVFSTDQNDYFSLLSDLILDYEQEIQPKTKPLIITERLAQLLENTGWTASDLGRFLGIDATMGNKILRGERNLTVEHIKKLSRHFALAPQYFM